MLLSFSSCYGKCGGRQGSKATGPQFLEGGSAVCHWNKGILSNEASGQCLGEDVRRIVFHVGRYTLVNKVWTNHHNRLIAPPTFRCPPDDFHRAC